MKPVFRRTGRTVVAKVAELIMAALGFIVVMWFVFNVFAPAMVSAITKVGHVPTPAPVVSVSPR